MSRSTTHPLVRILRAGTWERQARPGAARAGPRVGPARGRGRLAEGPRPAAGLLQAGPDGPPRLVRRDARSAGGL